MGKTPQFSCKIKLYIQKMLFILKMVFCFQITHTNHHMNRTLLEPVEHWCAQCNGKHSFSIHQNDLGLFCSVLHLLQTLHKCVVKYLRMLFLCIQNTQIHTVQIYLIFPTKTMYAVYIPTITKLHTVVSIQNNRKMYCIQL